MWMSNVETFLFNDKDKRYSYRDKQRPNTVASITCIQVYLPVTWMVRMRITGRLYYSPYYSKPSESLLMASLLIEATGAASS